MADTTGSKLGPPRAVETIQDLLTVSEDESEQLGLKHAPHGLILMCDETGYQWTKVTADMDYFALLVAAAATSEIGRHEQIYLHVEKFPIMFHGWPRDDIGDMPNLPDPELLPRSD